MPAPLKSGPPLGTHDPSREASDRLRAYAKALGKDYRIRIQASSAAATLILERYGPQGWKLAHSVTRPGAIDAIRALVGTPQSSWRHENGAAAAHEQTRNAP